MPYQWSTHDEGRTLRNHCSDLHSSTTTSSPLSLAKEAERVSSAGSASFTIAAKSIESNSIRERTDYSESSAMSDYSYEDEDDEYSYCDDDGEDNDGKDQNHHHGNHAAQETSVLDKQLKEIIAKYGDDVVAYCPKPLTHDPRVKDILYLIFPLNGGSMDALKRDFGEIWGFDPTKPIMLRMNVLSPAYFDTAPLNRIGDVAITVYQGDEPPMSWIRDASNSKKPEDEDEEDNENEDSKKEDSSNDSSSDGSDPENEEKGDKKKGSKGKDDEVKGNDAEAKGKDVEAKGNEKANDVEKKGSDAEKEEETTENEKKRKREATENEEKRKLFRLGDQLKRIADDFVVANWSGCGRKESDLALSDVGGQSVPTRAAQPARREQSSQACPICTYLNPNWDIDICEMCGYSLKLQSTASATATAIAVKDKHRMYNDDVEPLELQTSASTKRDNENLANFLSEYGFMDLEYEEEQQQQGAHIEKACRHCTYISRSLELGSGTCPMCGLDDAYGNNHPTAQLNCPHCTSLNPETADQCIVCDGFLGKRAPQEQKQHSAPQEQKKCRATSSQPDSRDAMLRPFLETAYSSGDGLIIRLYSYMKERIPQLHRFCVNCDQPHLSGCGIMKTSVQMMRPSVCRRDLCSWAFCEMGVGRTSTDELASTAEVVDLILAITTAAATSPRAAKILDPFPFVVDSKKRKILDPQKPDYQKAADMVQKLPSLQQLVASKNEAHQLEICKSRGEHVYDLLQWIVSSSTSCHLVTLRGKDRLTSMGTPYQFLMRSASPEHDRIFRLAKQKHGSIFGFHGSPIENWHAILRNGIKNCSGTELQLNGAAHGKGVYISPAASMSLGYSKIHSCRPQHQTQNRLRSGWPAAANQPNDNRYSFNLSNQASNNNFISDQKVSLLALCEIVDDGKIRKTSGDVWVVPNDRHIVTRFLFVFTPSSADFGQIYSAACKCNTNNEAFQHEINQAMNQVSGGGNY